MGQSIGNWRIEMNKVDLRLLSEYGETKNLFIKDSEIEECRDLQDICNLWNKDDKEYVEGEKFKDKYIEKCIKEGDLPPIKGAKVEFYKIKSIYLKDNEKLIGFLEVYHGYPSLNSFFLSTFVINPKYQKNGYAQEVIEYISKEVKNLDYERICIGVYLKNWKALRFWTKAGFDKILGIYGDKNYSENTYAFIGLEKRLV
ncbi:MAG: GNAT family N-acetyltransferase [Firmicutes bacterium]|nr:GNAT family N-acetyltransferase [Bacillota bacterium]